MPVREYAPLCLTRAFAGGRPKRLGVDRRLFKRMTQDSTRFKPHAVITALSERPFQSLAQKENGACSIVKVAYR